MIRAGHAAREQLDRAAQSSGFTPQVRFETESYDVAQAFVGPRSPSPLNCAPLNPSPLMLRRERLMLRR